MPRRDRQRRRHMLHQSGINPASDPNVVLVRLPETSPEEIEAISSMPLSIARYFLLKFYNASIALSDAGMKIWPDSQTVPVGLQPPLIDLFETRQEILHGAGLCDCKPEGEEDGKDN